MKFLDLFAGIGGFRLGLEQAGHECVGYVEWDKFARKSYEAIHNTEGEWTWHDITTIDYRDIPRADCWTFGFPCQDLSAAGEQKGFDGKKSSLFFAVTKRLRQIKEWDSEKMPSYLLVENVKNFFSVNRGWDFLKAQIELDAIGYNLEWQLLNSRDFGVPQNRERVFIVGHLRGRSTRKVFPIERSMPNNLELVGLLDIKGNESIRRVYKESGLCPTLTTMQGGNREPKILALRGRYDEDGSTSQRAEINNKNISNTLTTVQKDNLLLKQDRIRKLTPRECWRLQGFPDWAFDRAAAVNSDSQLYKQAGNSVTVNVIEAIGKKLL